MKYANLLLILFSVSATAFAQPGKNLTFAQIAFGGGYETVVNLTNRGTAVYNGTLTLRPTDPTRPYPARVNGNSVSAGMNLTLNPGATESLRITSGDASAGILSGFAIIRSTNRESASLLEGNLTYYVKSADGAILDSVGVAPSIPIRQAVIPFDDFQTIALALANPTNQTATVRLTLFNEMNTQMGGVTQALTNNQQIPKFLREFFPGVSLTKGRVEIQSDRAIAGTALAFVGGEASSLPFLPSIKMYEARLDVPGEGTFTGHVYATILGDVVTGYVVDTMNGVPQPDTLETFVGRVRDGNLEISDLEGSNEISFVRFPGFNPLARTQSGTIMVYSLNPPRLEFSGTITLTAIN